MGKETASHWKRERQKTKMASKSPPALLNHSVSLIVSLLVVVIASLYISSRPKQRETEMKSRGEGEAQAMGEIATSTTAEIFGVKIERNLPQSKLDELGVSTWPKWGCQPSKFPWTFEATETMYLLEGKVDVSVDGHVGTFQIGAGDLVVFPKGMKIQWDVLEAVNKHYSLEK